MITAVGHVDRRGPGHRREPAQLAAGLEHPRPVVSLDLVVGPRVVVAAAAGDELVGQPATGRPGAQSRRHRQAVQRDEPEPLLGHPRGEVARRGAQHQARRPASDGAARSAGRSVRPSSSRPRSPGRGPSTSARATMSSAQSSSRNGPARAQAPAVAPLVEGQHPEATGQLSVRGEPVHVGRHRPAVEQHDGRRTRRPGQLAHEGGAPPGQLHRAPRWQPRSQDRIRTLDRGAHETLRRPPPRGSSP